MGLGSRNKVNAEFSMSSMTDLVFLLLIFFIMISTMVTPYANKVALPDGDVPSIFDKARVDIQITADTTYYINGEATPYLQLEAAITQKFAEISPEEKHIILLSVDKTVPSGILTRFVAMAKGNGWGLGLKTSGQTL